MCFRDSECCEMVTCRRCNHFEEGEKVNGDWSELRRANTECQFLSSVCDSDELRSSFHSFASAQRKFRRKYWQEKLSDYILATPELRVEIVSESSVLDGIFFKDTGIFRYADDSHINITTDNGVNVGIPSCYIVSVVLTESEPKVYSV